MITSKSKKAWLITWEWHGEHNEKTDKIVRIINYRFSDSTVRDIVEQIYVDSEYSLLERLQYIKSYKNKRSIPDRTRIRNFHINCGYNPYLWARLVKNIKVVDEDGKENLEWEETSNPNKK